MRNLSNEEKSFLKELIKISNTSHNVFIGNVVDRELNDIDIFLDYTNVKVEYRFDKIMYDNDPNGFMYFSRDFSWKFIRYVQLLKYFEKNGLLFLYQEGKLEGVSRFGRLVRDNNYISSQITDEDAVRLILDFSGKTIVINQSLIDFVTYEFKTPEDIKHNENIVISEKNLKISNESLNASVKSLDIANKALISSTENIDIAKKTLETSNKSLKRSEIAIIITIIIFIIGTIINIYINYREPNPIKIDKEQLDRFEKIIKESRTNEINTILKSMDSSNNVKRKNLKEKK